MQIQCTVLSTACKACGAQEVVDIEESVWGTKYGIKGMVDVSVRLALEDPAALRARQVGAAGAAGRGYDWGHGP